MAATKSARGSSAKNPLAIELLMSDHRKVEQLFEQYEDEKEGDEDARRGIAERICGELKVHAQVEEELFYPWLREKLPDDEIDMVEEAAIEHQSAKDLIAQIEAAGEVDAKFDALVKVLSEYIKHHVKEEEQEIFPEVASEKKALDELGQEMTARKAELIEEMGFDSDEDTPPPAKAKGTKPEPAQRSR